ncbi:MAG: hypothetical protein ACE5E8_06930 [Acidimicrobiia bacterium]
MLLVTDLEGALADLADGTLDCPTKSCDDRLRPWGHARARRVRHSIDRVTTLRPRRARCRSCRRSHVLSELVTYPRRLDTTETVGQALLAAADGLGYRRVADIVERPATTVRDWLRRARANSEAVRGDATIAIVRLDPNHDPTALAPTGTVLGDALDALGHATAAWVGRFGPCVVSWQLTAHLTRAAFLAVRPHPYWHDPF